VADLSRIALFMPKRTDDPHILALATSYLELLEIVKEALRDHDEGGDDGLDCCATLWSRPGKCDCGAEEWNARRDKALDFAAKGCTVQ